MPQSSDWTTFSYGTGRGMEGGEGKETRGKGGTSVLMTCMCAQMTSPTLRRITILYLRVWHFFEEDSGA